MKIMVTGASGFIGKKVCAFLSQKQHDVIPVVRTPTQADLLAPSYKKIIVGDLIKDNWAEQAQRAEPQTVIHLAAVTPNYFNGNEAQLAAQKNTQIDSCVFEYCSDNKVGMIYASGTSVYGLGDGSVKTESADPKPVGPYVAQKVQSEKFGQALLLNNGINFISLRISAPYGPGQKSRTVLNIFIERALKGLALLYHGTGSRQQTFTHIDDVVHAFDRAIESGASGIFNIAGSEFVTVKQLANLVVSIIPNCASEVRPSEIKDPQEGATAMFSITKARQILGWRPTVSLQTGLTSCIQGKRTN